MYFKRDYINIGPVPCEEDCAQVGKEGYREKGIAECKRFIALLRRTLGEEPEGAELKIKWFDHDFGSYCEVVCYYEIGNQEATDYAFRCESECPLTWEGGEHERKVSSG